MPLDTNTSTNIGSSFCSKSKTVELATHSGHDSLAGSAKQCKYDDLVGPAITDTLCSRQK